MPSSTLEFPPTAPIYGGVVICGAPMPFLLAFTLFALLDFVILFSVGSQIGLLTTLLLVLATGFIGLHLIRREGAATFARARERLERGEMPSGELLTGAALIFGGALLMAPGFVSDALGFLCLIPDARRLLGKLLTVLGLRMGSVQVHAGGGASAAPPGAPMPTGSRPPAGPATTAAGRRRGTATARRIPWRATSSPGTTGTDEKILIRGLESPSASPTYRSATGFGAVFAPLTRKAPVASPLQAEPGGR